MRVICAGKIGKQRIFSIKYVAEFSVDNQEQVMAASRKTYYTHKGCEIH